MRRLLLVVVGVTLIAAGAAVAWVALGEPGPSRALPPPATTLTSERPPIGVDADDDAPEPPRGAIREAGQPPDDLVRTEIIAAMDRVKPRVANCFDLFNQPGLATVRLQVASSGRVTSAKVEGELAGTQTAQCVEAAARNATFRSFKRASMTVTWPFVLKGEGAAAHVEEEEPQQQ